ncbi:hypothetical protein PFAG_06077 [Plasmodium falciparum Santa Lucia]|uniref:Surface antigen n=1 Tax=Plasmodium falciparum Santa Lucia TaxID=478859 RepID=W7FNC5_PLAFA|nr:hypothetical protein PFAG_06077 [Plasmodium falciparum Santa Lucia]
MRIHYINMFLFSLMFNILLNVHKNHYNTTLHTPNTTKIPTTRLLCECELYAPPNYNNDPEMKQVMDNFDRHTQQRFHEYEQRMIKNRKQCKEQCEKDIQKIILKEKIQKELREKLSALQIDISTHDIPTCVCEKSIADKVEKGCLKCTQNLGGIVAPSSGVLAGIAEGALHAWKPTAITAAKKAALAEATDAATKAGMKAVSLKIKGLRLSFTDADGFIDLSSIVSKLTYKNGDALVESAKELIGTACINPNTKNTTSFYNSVIVYGGESNIKGFAQAGSDAFQATLTTKTAEFKETYMAAVNSTYAGWQTAIIASIVTIVVIVLIMVIIYLILRNRRKKKMKKKLQYIKLLKE